MKIIRRTILIDNGAFSSSSKNKKIQLQIEEAIKNVTNPLNSDKFHIYPERRGNGVKPLKLNFQSSLVKNNWSLETRLEIDKNKRPGPIDATFQFKNGSYYAVEWETGNVSSSHRALNKLIVGLQNKKIRGGTLIVPIKNTAQYLTDRIGNFEELEPYFSVWRAINNIENGFLEIIGIEHDELTDDITLKIPKGNDGMSKK